MSLIASLVLLTFTVLPLPASAWNIPGHTLSGAIAYQVLSQENPRTIDKVKAVLEKHPWYVNQWQASLQDVPVADRDLVLFMQAARWARRCSHPGQSSESTTLALHQLPLQTRRTTGERANQRARASKHPDCDD